jgi:hypothetical protein
MVNKCFGGVPPRNIGEGQWLEIDLEGYYRICGIEAYWERARSDEYTIDISADRCNWTTIVDFSRPPAEVAALGNSGQPIDVFLPGDFLPDGDYCARFVRWHSKEDPINANGFLNYSLFEFQVYGQDNCGTPPIEPPVNILAAQPPVLVQINRDPTGSDPGGPLPDKAPFSPEIFVAGGSVIADGDTANYPVSANLYELRHLAASPPAVDPDHGVITITLAEKTWIDKAVILWDTRSLPSRFVVRTSCEGSPFELAGRVNATANWNVENGDGLWDVIEFDEKVVADKVRIVLQERCNLYSAEIGMGIREVELFCTEPTVDPAICAVP